MIDSKLYAKRISDLVKYIKDISNNSVDNGISKAVCSHKIMKLLREECVFIRKEYLVAANHNKYATLNPDDEGVKNKISPNNLVTEWFPIFANSFGPFNPQKYFASPIKILWLLKEPFIEKETWIKGDRGKHDQAEENKNWDEIEENPTLENLIKRTQTILNEINHKSESTISEQAAMSQTCILEFNHFPGLAFKAKESKKQLLKIWSDKNMNLIKQLIEFYEPTIIISGGVHDYYHNSWDTSEFIDKNPLEKLGFTMDQSFIKSHPDCLDNNYILRVVEENGPIFVIAYHPARELWYSDARAKEDGERIRKYNLLPLDK